MKKLPLVSIIITTKNEAEVIERLLRSIKLQTYPKIEIILVDNKSSDLTRQLAKKYTEFVYTHGPERSAQRNLGYKKSQGELTLFLDADMELDCQLIQKSVELFNSKKSDAIVIPERSVASNFWEGIKAYERSFYNLSGDETTDAARFFRRRVFEVIGGYDTTITGPEDWDLPDQVKRLGYRVNRVNSLILHYERIPSLRSLLKKKYYYGLGSYRYLKKNQIPVIGAKTVYFLRPVFYKQWRVLIGNPFLSLMMFYMLGLEVIFGGMGYLKGRLKSDV